MQEAQPEDNRPFKDWVLQKEAELRVEIGDQDNVEIRVGSLSGLTPNRQIVVIYLFPVHNWT